VILRNATAYGDSPMQRIDLVVNNLLACAIVTGQIRIMSDGTPWRPLIHCRDIARAFIAFMNAPAEDVCGKAVNIGANDENYQVRDVGDIIQDVVPSTDIVYTGEVGNDPRSYRVRFDLLGDLLDDFHLVDTVRTGAESLRRHLSEYAFSKGDFESDQFVRMRTLSRRIERIAVLSTAR